MASTNAKRRWWADRRCDTTGLASISFLSRGEPDTVAKVLVQPEVVEIWEAVETVLRNTEYGEADVVGSIRHCPFGIGGKRCEPSGKNCSLHNYCLALDIDPWGAGNPHFKRPWPMWSWSKVKFTKAQVRAVEAIRMLDKSKPLRWLGWAIGDTMHWEIDIPPASAMSGVDWSTVEGFAPPPETLHMAYADTLNLNDWVSTLRPEDIDQLFALRVHSPASGAAHWKGLLAAHPNAADADAWENFRRTTSARIGFWQPEGESGPASQPSSYQITGDITPT